MRWAFVDSWRADSPCLRMAIPGNSVVGEADNELVDHAVLAHCAGNWRYLHVSRQAADEPGRVELAHVVIAVAAGHDWNMRDVGRWWHRRCAPQIQRAHERRPASW